ncbi:MAG: MoxR family ATPase [Chthonomonas sp.]|nr:MoxR family ATPase [Chthonomonas sp.]
MEISAVAKFAQAIAGQLNHVIAGKSDATRDAVIILLCEGHLLVEDVPGVGKTTLAKALAKSIGGSFSRIQFTPDLLPADVTGSPLYNQKEMTFEFRPGPVFANVLLADEINRATPKTQSALLEAMEERTVTADGEERPLPSPFMVVATQNNVEMSGTYPLPEAQMDRFFGRISLGYPDREAETQMLEQQRETRPVDHLSPVVTTQELVDAQKAVRSIHVDQKLQDYIVSLVRATRDHSHVGLGASPRASLHLQHAAQAHAAWQGMDYVVPDDVKAVATMVLAHRIIPRGESRSRGDAASDIITSVLNSVPTPLPVR